MSMRGGGSGRGSASNGVQQLRDKIAQLLNAAGMKEYQHKTDYLSQYIAKWSMNTQRLSQQQFNGALQSLHLPLGGAGEVFAALDRDGNGTISITEFVESMIGTKELPQPSRPRLSMRTAGSEVVSGGRQVSGDRRVFQAQPAERGYTPTFVAGMERTAPMPPPLAPPSGPGSRSQSRLNSASRMTPGSGGGTRGGGSMRPPPAPVAPSQRPRPQMSGGPGTEMDFSDVIVNKFREIVLARAGSSGIHSLSRIFRIMDDDRNRKINLEELRSGMQDFGLTMGMKDVQLLLAAIDKNNSGNLSFEEFMLAIRGVINPRRETLIMMAFDALDHTGDGLIQADDLANRFNARGHPDVINGRMPPDHALTHLIQQFDGIEQDGMVTREEFLEYYKNVSASIDDDDHFELMIRNAWHITGGVGQCQNTSNTRILVKFVDGSQKVVCLEHDIGMNLHDDRAVKAQLRAQGLSNVVSYSLGTGL